MENFRFHHDLRVRFSEVDVQHIVYNANYLMYMDTAYQDYMRNAVKLVDVVPPTVLATSTLNFKQAAFYDDSLQVWMRVAKFGRTSLTAEFVISRDEEVVFDGQTVYVYVHVATRQPQPVPTSWRHTIAEFEPACVPGSDLQV